ncbi:MAG: hypothetical protein QOE05_1311 [Actinomycetota bacterium]|jgi:hypothetical protein|nr:hypothetical protein [Actinomycetota bacterium]
MSTRRTARGLGVLALLVPLSGVGLLLSAAPAGAATGITAPGNGTAYISDTNIRISATVDKNTGSAQLRLQPPTGDAETVDTASTSLTAGASLSYDFDTATCASFPAACSGRAEAPNGEWTVSLVSGGGVVDTSSFTLRIAPRAPRNVTAKPDGYRAVVVTWTRGDEPDLTGWTIYGDGNPSQDVGPEACSGTGCSATVTYGGDGTGEHRYALMAHRRVAPGSTETVDSEESSEVTATLDSPPPPPPPSPSADGSGTTGGTTGDGANDSSTGGSTGGSSGGSTSTTGGGSSTGGSTGSGSSTSGSTGKTTAIGTGKAPATLAQRRAFALTFKAFAPKLGIPKLPPLPAAQGPSVAPLPDGTYEKTLGYKDVVKTEKVDSPQAAARRVTGAVSSALDSDQFLRFMAGALILLLLAAHARRWVASHDDE